MGIQFFSVDETVNTFPWICQNHSKSFNHMNKAKEYLMGNIPALHIQNLQPYSSAASFQRNGPQRGKEALPRGFRQRSSKISTVGGILSVKFKLAKLDTWIWSPGPAVASGISTDSSCSQFSAQWPVVGDLEENGDICLELNPQILVLLISLKLSVFPSCADLVWSLQ